MVHGTEEQKRRFVVPWMRGEVNNFQVFTEPEAGSDLASLRTRGVRDGDEWIINGSKQFISGTGKPDWLFTLVNTNPEAPRHENISLFMIKGDSAGITIQNMDLISMEPGGGGQNFVFFDNVRVPAENLIGEEGKGWAMANTTLELEHGGSGSVGGTDQQRATVLQRVVDYLKAS
jgi:alkylation response protein AidB-like acyl-CoA dehydrogenase